MPCHDNHSLAYTLNFLTPLPLLSPLRSLAQTSKVNSSNNQSVLKTQNILNGDTVNLGSQYQVVPLSTTLPINPLDFPSQFYLRPFQAFLPKVFLHHHWCWWPQFCIHWENGNRKRLFHLSKWDTNLHPCFWTSLYKHVKQASQTQHE